MIGILFTGVVNEEVDKDGGLSSLELIVLAVPHKLEAERVIDKIRTGFKESICITGTNTTSANNWRMVG